jgi:hypothetical protein
MLVHRQPKINENDMKVIMKERSCTLEKNILIIPSNRSYRSISNASSCFCNLSNVCGVTLFNMALQSRKTLLLASSFV